MASVRTELEATCQIDKFGRTLGTDGEGASQVIGIDKEAKYLETARRRIRST